MHHATTPRALALTVFAAVSALAFGPAPGRAAVIQSAATSAVFGSELRFVPSSRAEMLFDSSLGTLNGITLSFDGTITASIGNRVADEPPFPAAVTAEVGIRSGNRTVASFDPISVPVTFTEREGTDSAIFPYSVQGSATVAAAFQVAIAGVEALSDSFNTVFRWADIRPGTWSSMEDAIFRGGVSAIFDYTPVGGEAAGGAGVTAPGGATNVPEPAALAVFGVGLLGLVASRFRRPA